MFEISYPSIFLGKSERFSRSLAKTNAFALSGFSSRFIIGACRNTFSSAKNWSLCFFENLFISRSNDFRTSCFLPRKTFFIARIFFLYIFSRISHSGGFFKQQISRHRSIWERTHGRLCFSLQVQ